ncbi:MAG: DNA-binding protein [Hapalosiphonaceae cyanobacterium JJU2]|nr:MAG: DNA-binding protein [Hapalosiphonaceae cyanobacterium JJU2]
MNKQQAAEFLGVSVRALERYVQQGRIGVKYEKGKTRPTANFNPTELETFKEELNQPSYKPVVEPRQITTEPIESSDKLVHDVGEISEFGSLAVVDHLSDIIEALLTKSDLQPTVPIQAKLLLTISEAQALTGLSREILRDAIINKKLSAAMIGRSWRIKRSDLEDYIANLF